MAELLDAKPRTIQFYTDEGLLFTKEEDQKTGRVTPRKYSEEEMLYFLLIKELTKLWIFDLKIIKRIIHTLYGKENIKQQEFIVIVNHYLEDKIDFIYETTGDKKKYTVDMKKDVVAVVLNVTELRKKAKAMMPTV